MSESLVWLLYLVAGALAFAAVFYKGWPLTLAMLIPTIIATAIWYAVVELGKEENEPAWINVDLALNASFALIFAGAGAGLAMFLRSRKRRSDDSDPIA